MMKMVQSRQEKLKKKKEAEKKRYEKLKATPEGRETLRKKEHEKYLKKKEKKIRQPIAQLSERSKRNVRKNWRYYSARYREKQKQKQNLSLVSELESPRDSPQSISGKRCAARNRKIRSRVLKIKDQKIQKLQTQINALRVKCTRIHQESLQQQSDTEQPNKNSPENRARTLLQENENAIIYRKLLFAEAIKDQLTTNYEQLQTRKDKSNFRRAISGPLTKKYHMTKDIRAILRGHKIIVNSSAGSQKRNALIKCQKINAVRKFLESDINSRLCPGKRDFCSKNGVIKQKRYLNDTMFNLHKAFVNKYPDRSVSYSFWCKYRPFYIVPRKVGARDTCGCTVCLNMTLLIQALSRNDVLLSDSSTVMSNFCCDNKTEKCLLRDCRECQNKKTEFKNCDRTTLSHYFKWTTQKDTFIDPKSKKEKTVVKTVKKKINCSIAEMIDEFEANIIKYLKHRGRERHQHQQIKKLKDNLKDNEALFHMDFSENYNLKYAEEIQAFHFGGSRKQISLHTVVVYIKFNGKLETKCFCTMSECLQHNVAGIWAHLKPILKYIEDNCVVDTLHFVSDSPATQYRNKTMFYFLAAELSKLYPKLQNLSWNYLEAGHGKGAADGIGGVTKRTADRLVAQGNDVASFDSLLHVLTDNVKKITYLPVTEDDIKDMSKKLENIKFPNFKGTLQVHQVKCDLTQSVNPKLRFYSLSSLDNDDFYYMSSLTYELASSSQEENMDSSRIENNATPTLNNLQSQQTQHHRLNYHDVYSDSDDGVDDPDGGDVQRNNNETTFHSVKCGDYMLIHLKQKKCYTVAVAQNDMENTGRVKVKTFRICSISKKQSFQILDNESKDIENNNIVKILPSPSQLVFRRKEYIQFEQDIDVSK